jgi:hypothetical protein
MNDPTRNLLAGHDDTVSTGLPIPGARRFASAVSALRGFTVAATVMLVLHEAMA